MRGDLERKKRMAAYKRRARTLGGTNGAVTVGEEKKVRGGKRGGEGVVGKKKKKGSEVREEEKTKVVLESHASVIFSKLRKEFGVTDLFFEGVTKPFISLSSHSFPSGFFSFLFFSFLFHSFFLFSFHSFSFDPFPNPFPQKDNTSFYHKTKNSSFEP